MQSNTLPVPTLDDLRVKLCYICREEETFDNPEVPTRKWTHPCKCTLIAHESCLLRWIQTAEGGQRDNALKCPQCGATYEMESDNPLLLQILSSGNRLLTKAGSTFTVAGVGILMVSAAGGMYILLTAYGAYALRQFLGSEMYNLILTDDPSNWPWHAFFNLPAIPLSLILSRFPVLGNYVPYSLYLVWPPAAPTRYSEKDRILSPELVRQLNALYDTKEIFSWPPSPAAFCFFVYPFARLVYRIALDRVKRWILNDIPAVRNPPPRRFGMDFLGLIQIGLEIDVDERQRPRRGERQQRQEGNDNIIVDPEQGDPVAAAERVILPTGTLGRIVGGALLMPALASFMGSILFRLSAHSPLLRKFLAVRTPLSTREGGRITNAPPFETDWTRMSTLKQMALGLKLGFRMLWSGSPVWLMADPVWWRNSIGLGLFSVARDCIHLLHLWLKKRELQSRRVKNRSFAGIDPSQLDLIRPLAWTSPS